MMYFKKCSKLQVQGHRVRRQGRRTRPRRLRGGVGGVPDIRAGHVRVRGGFKSGEVINYFKKMFVKLSVYFLFCAGPLD